MLNFIPAHRVRGDSLYKNFANKGGIRLTGGGWLYAIIVLIVTTNKAKKFLTKVLKEGAVYGMI